MIYVSSQHSYMTWLSCTVHLCNRDCISPGYSEKHWLLCFAEMVPAARPARGSILCAVSVMLEKGKEKLPVLSCWPTTRMQQYQPWVSLSWMYYECTKMLSWESRQVAETVSRQFCSNNFFNNGNVVGLEFIFYFRSLYRICGFPF